MSFSSNRLSERMEELRFPSIRSPDLDSFTNGTNPGRADSYFSALPPINDPRASLQRRFTTDSSKISMARPFGSQFGAVSAQTIKNKQMEEIQREKRKAEEQLRLLELQERSIQMGASRDELESISTRLHRMSLTGPVSEPTTPPEYADSQFSNRYSRSSRVSTNSTISPPGLTNRASQPSSQITSPGLTRFSGGMYSQGPKPSAKSVPGSRRGSDEEEDYPDHLPQIRQVNGSNRFSMPVASNRVSHRYSMNPAQTRASYTAAPISTSFLDDNDNDQLPLGGGLDLTSPIAKTFAQLEGDDFPTLTSDGLRLSANPAALDLANSKTPDSDWSLGSRYRPSHQSMPHTDSSMYRPILANLSSPPADRPAELSRRKSQRHSLGVTFEEGPKYDISRLPTSMPMNRPASLQTSFSTNDVPTVKKGLAADTSPQSDQFHSHNVSMGRIPASSSRQSRDLTNGTMYTVDEVSTPASALQASATPFGPGYSGATDSTLIGLGGPTTAITSPNFAFGGQAFGQANLNGVVQPFGTQNSTLFGLANGYGTGYGKTQEPSRATSGHRHNYDENRFNNVPLESYRGRLYELCKDQHGCRYLQRKLEDGDPEHIQTIFAETCPHIRELMTDPFGNYLCQKLFEHCNEEQRTTLIAAASDALPTIALNQHGTRALQKMIEFVHTDEQTAMIIKALEYRVVDLVQDLNGNHVIQKCLTRLGAETSQFIYNAVAQYCVVVGTHRHGCCVLQRCIDHAKGAQRARLIARITECAFDLVQDPFGNYVVQYILDLDEPTFTKPLCDSFKGRVVALSKQKFSSNVIEKCLRTADQDSKRALIDEMMLGNELEKMLRDSFANYVVQTALEFADEQSRARLTDAIRPILPAIKSTPHGRRIASKIMGTNDNPGRVNGSDSFGGGAAPTSRASGRRQIQIVGGGFNLPRASNGFPSGSGDSSNGTNFGYANNAGYGANATNDVSESPVAINPAQGFGAPAQNGYGSYGPGLGGTYL
ncbi:hypothetical protein DV738_g3205, partial [Chaetothyriales sp. CBS 135597]